MNDYIENNRRPFTGLASLFYIDLKLFMPIVIITIIGLVTIYSSSSGDIALVLKQLTRILIGVIVMIFIAQVHPDNLILTIPEDQALQLSGPFAYKILSLQLL